MPKSVCVLLLGTALLSCSDQKEIQITGTVRNLNGGMIVYQQSIAGMMNTKTIDTLQIQSDSTFTLTLPVEDYERVNFILYGKAVLGSVISKGGKIQLDVDATAQKPLTIRGVDEKAVAVSRLLNRLNAAVWDLRARRGRAGERDGADRVRRGDDRAHIASAACYAVDNAGRHACFL